MTIDEQEVARRVGLVAVDASVARSLPYHGAPAKTPTHSIYVRIGGMIVPLNVRERDGKIVASTEEIEDQYEITIEARRVRR